MVDLQENTAVVNGKSYSYSVASGGSAPAASAAAPAAAGGKAVSAKLPGLVVRVEVDVNDTVAEGDVLMILEAMKMETEVKADSAGTITEVCVNPGDQVKAGQDLVKIG